MAIPITYESCLTDEALESAVADYTDVQTRREAQDKERSQFEEEQKAARESKAANGETFDEEERTWEEIEFAPFQTHQEQYVVCLDTLG